MEHQDIARYFTRSDGSYLFARWGRPIVPVVFGVDDRTLSIIKGAIEAVVVLADHRMAETDPELGANLVMFFFRDWDELTETPDLDRLIPDLGALVGRLKEADANQYRLFRFDPSGAIKAVFVFVRMDDGLADVPAEDVALAQAAQATPSSPVARLAAPPSLPRSRWAASAKAPCPRTSSSATIFPPG